MSCCILVIDDSDKVREDNFNSDKVNMRFFQVRHHLRAIAADGCKY